MTRPLLTALLLGCSLASCAPSMTTSTHRSPVREGQVWTMTAGTATYTLTAGPTTTRSGADTVFNTGTLRGEGTSTVKDNFAFSPKSTVPAFMMIGQLRVLGADQTSVECVVRDPVETLNVPQPGLYRVATPADFAKGEDAVLAALTDGLFLYVLDSSLAPSDPCTVTRVK